MKNLKGALADVAKEAMSSRHLKLHDQVVSRYARRLRLRRSVGIAAAAVLVPGVIIGFQSYPAQTTETAASISPSPAQTQTPVASTVAGARILGKTELTGRRGDSSQFTITPTSLDLFITTECAPRDSAVILSFRINGRSLKGAAGGCGHTTRNAKIEESTWRSLGVELGKPTTVEVTSGVLDILDGPVPDLSGTRAFAAAYQAE